jgi:hypothetical protein
VPTIRDLLSSPPIHDCTPCTPSLSNLLKIQEHIPSCPWARGSPPPHSASACPSQSPRLARYPSQRVIPIQAPYPRVAPRLKPVDVSYPRVARTFPRNSIIPLTPHPAAENSPYVPQGMAGMNLFDKFEEEHMETTSLPRYNTRARARQHSANQAYFLAPRVFLPIAFKNNQGGDVASDKPLIIFLWPML